MASTTKIKKEKRERRHKRIRAKIAGTSTRPRLSFHKSNTRVRAQLIDDERSVTLLQVQSKDTKGKTMTEEAKSAGEELAKMAMSKKISNVVFDRGGFIFTGKVKAFADGARKGGLKF